MTELDRAKHRIRYVITHGKYGKSNPKAGAMGYINNLDAYPLLILFLTQLSSSYLLLFASVYSLQVTARVYTAQSFDYLMCVATDQLSCIDTHDSDMVANYSEQQNTMSHCPENIHPISLCSISALG